MLKLLTRTAKIGFMLIIGLAYQVPAYSAEQVNIYSHRQPYLLQPFLDIFTEQTGIETNVIYADKGLAERLELEGEKSPADVVLTVDIARLQVYVKKSLLSPVDSDILKQNIPAHLRDVDNQWFALSKRTRLLAVSKDRVAEGELTRIEQLSDPKWKGRICTRPGSHNYNRALLASILAANGEVNTLEWTRGLVKNLARRPQGNDRAQIKAIAQGQCDIAIVNHYYYGVMLNSDDAEQRQAANTVMLVFPNQGATDRGAHINVSGGGVTRYSKNKENAIKLLEFLSSPPAQKLYADINFEYPVNKTVGLSSSLDIWGNFKADEISINDIANLSPSAQRIIDIAGW